MPTSACCCNGSSKPMGSNLDVLLREATAARHNASVHISGFKVGAAIETAGGKVFSGCNIENVSLGLTVCAERVALLKALSEGEREFRRIAVVSDTDTPTPPCGACRQFLWEYCGDVPVLLHSLGGQERTLQLAELLPLP